MVFEVAQTISPASNDYSGGVIEILLSPEVEGEIEDVEKEVLS